jgi:PII-like signaling protein
LVTVCDLLHRRGVAGATVLLGVDGTAHGERKRARFLGGNTDVPMMIIAVGSGGSGSVGYCPSSARCSDGH